ncbi:hypothetical protein K504DRAFT_458377 [Pleomassaria siparia CBS 279.74]|uniref:Phosphatidylinositol N-acetylglucosaminyltransferase subunit H conserved domain-containing protein n=1 Tax=Pleomassaria siparia CBS 279.74 TaxID=1314801 RepID=A0A6G1K4S5_9PLEO|nr:hypothetical protein K504DRAFT_458377 [Pleomassaria siparia CBS 279.74]
MGLKSPPVQTLTTLQPTSSTISYTVSTRPVPKTLPGVVGLYLSLFVRAAIGAITVVVLWTKWRTASDKSTASLGWVAGAVVETWMVKAMHTCKWRYVAPCAILILWLVFRRGYTEESLTLLRGLGLQTSTSSSTYLRTPVTRFIPTTEIQDIFIHEAFKGFEVRFYLGIVVKNEKDVVVVFPTLLPRRAILEEVWRGARACLYGSGGGGEKSNKGDTRE